MELVFYDLETSDRFCIGQILNYCFTRVTPDFEILGELSGCIALSPLQLPSPDAILTNRIDLRAHAEGGPPSEFLAMLEIAEFLQECIRVSGSIALIGYNSSKFDLPFLRTSLIRNGINPYFGGKVVYRDLLFLSRRLGVNGAVRPPAADDPAKLSLSLERISTELGLLHEAQEHEARADVHLTISVARAFRDRFGLDVGSYDPYEIRNVERSGSTPILRVFAYPQYDLTKPEFRVDVPHLLLHDAYRSALWVDLSKFAVSGARDAVRWVSKSAGSMLLSPEQFLDGQAHGLALAAREKFKGLTVDNFFSRSVCDIELDIYRLDFDALELLRRAIHDGEPAGLRASSNRDLRSLYTRFSLDRHFRSPTSEVARAEELLCSYANYRYGGALVLSKQACETPELHPKFSNYRERLVDVLASGVEEDRALMRSLAWVYETSPVARGLL